MQTLFDVVGELVQSIVDFIFIFLKLKQANLLMRWDVMVGAMINLCRRIGSKDETVPFSQLIGD